MRARVVVVVLVDAAGRGFRLRQEFPVLLGRHDAELGRWIGKVMYPFHVSSVVDVEPFRNGILVHERMLH